MERNELTIRQVIELIPRLRPEHQPVLLVGSTGIGKTAAVYQGASLAGREVAPLPPVSTMLPEDAQGVPVPDLEAMVARFVPPNFWKVRDNALLFLDEINRARPDVQDALFSVVWPVCGKRRAGSLELPDGVLVIAAANPPSGRHLVNEMSSALLARFRIVRVRADPEEWIAWAISQQLPLVPGFIKARQSLLAPDVPEDAVTQLCAFPTPRGWEAVGRTILEGHTPLIEYALIEGAVGPGAAAEFAKWRRSTEALPDPRDLALGRAKLPDEDLSLALTGAINAAYAVLNMAPNEIRRAFEVVLDWPADVVVAGFLGTLKAANLKARLVQELGPAGAAAVIPDEFAEKFLDFCREIRGVWNEA